MEDLVRYVPTDSPPAPATVQRVMHDLRMAAEEAAQVVGWSIDAYYDQ